MRSDKQFSFFTVENPDNPNYFKPSDTNLQVRCAARYVLSFNIYNEKIPKNIFSERIF